MSGGHWNYQNRKLEEYVEKLPLIIAAISLGLEYVDYALSGDTSRDKAKDQLFSLFETLGDKLYGEE